jgi:hypothetical protein
MADKVDLSLTGQADPSNKDYYLVKISKLKTDLAYTAKFQWSFQDQTLNDKVQSLWSNGYQFTTIKLPTLLPPKFLNTDLSYFNGILIITWNGLDAGGNPYTKSFDRINVYVKDETVIGGVYRLVGSLKAAGTIRVAVPPRAHSVKLTVVDAEGVESDFSIAQFETPKLTPSTLPTSASGSWIGTNFKVSFTHNAAEEFFSLYKVKLTAGGVSKVFDVPATPGTTAQSFTLSLSQNRAVFGVPQTTISGSISVVNIYGNESAEVPFSASSYVNTLPAAIIVATAISNGYSISYTTPTDSTFNTIEIEEVESASATAPSTGYGKVFSGSSNPAIIAVGDATKRWVRARFTDGVGSYGSYGPAVAVTPIDLIAAALDITPPTAATINSAVWSGNNITISATVAADVKKFIIRLTNGSTVGFFTKFPSVAGTSQTILLTEQELYNTLGSYFTSFSGLFVSADALDNRDAGVAFVVAEKVNELSAITPTFTLTAISNGYSVSYSLPAGAAYAKVYASTTSGFTPSDATNLVYSGASPGIVIDSVYTLKYVKIKYFKTDGSASLISAQQSITPADPGMLSLIDNEVKISTSGSILAGDSASSGARAILNKTGVYFYDNAGNATSQLMANAASGSPTFITTNAKIADWKIYSDKIENQLIAGITKFAGLSASGTYAFWAGSTTSGGDAQSEFSVTQAGAVQAKNITISGGSLTVGASTIAASTGKLTSTDAEITGKITASTGKIGNLNIDSGALYTGTNPLVSSVTLNSAGIAGYNAAGSKLFGLDTSGYLFSDSASIGGWNVVPSTISKTSDNGTLTLNSSTAQITATSATYTAGIATPNNNNPADIVFWAGGQRNTSAPFYVRADGGVVMTTATITGYAGPDELDLLAKKDMTNVTSISGGKITTGVIKSSGFTASTDALVLPYSAAGVSIDLDNGIITSPKFYLGSDGTAKFKGTLDVGISISSPTITSAQITGSTITVTDNITSSGLSTASDSDLSETNDSSTGGGTSTVGATTFNPTLTLANGKISSNSILQISGASYTEILSGGTQSAIFDSSKSSLVFSTGLYLGNPNTSSSASIQGHSTPYISIDARMRLRRGAPLTYPGGTTGAYVRNIYIKSASTTYVPAATTGYVGDIMITY